MEFNTTFLSERLIEIEDKYNLFDVEVSGKKIWQYIRYRYWVQLCEELTESPKRTEFVQVNKNKIIDYNWKIFLRKQQFLLKRKDLLVINHPRRVKDGNIYKCFVTDTLLKHINYSYYVFEDEYRGGHDNPVTTKNLKYRDFSLLKNLFVYNQDVFKRGIRIEIDKIHSIFEKELSIKLSNKFKKKIYNITNNILRELFYGKLYAKIVLNFVRPKAILIVVYYNIYNQAMIEVAKEMGIVTIELEHGRMGYTHPAYNFKQRREIESFPDYIFVYGKYEKDTPRFPIQNEKICIAGYPELEEKAKKYRGNKGSRVKTILFVSSPNSGGKIISKYAIYLRKKNNTNIKIIYKLHPLEYGIWRKFYPELDEAGIEVVDNNDYDIYHFLGISDYVVGISSTALFEALQFDISIIIIKEQDYLICEPIYTNKCAFLVTEEKHMYDVIMDNKKQIKPTSDFYFATNSLKKIKEHIKRCMAQNGRKQNYKEHGKEVFTRFRLLKLLIKYKFSKINRKKSQDKESIKKYFNMYQLMAKWIKLKQEGKSVSEYLISKGYKEIAIYGMDIIGETLFNELNNSDIRVIYGIDKGADGIYFEVDVFKPEDNLLSVDAIIVTPFIYFSEIKGELEKKVKCPIISIEDIIYQIESQYSN